MITRLRRSIMNIFRKGVSIALTITAISVGVASVIIISAMSDTGAKMVSKELDSLGLNGLSVSHKNNDRFSFEDAAILRELEGVESAAPFLAMNGQISNGETLENVSVWGTQGGEEKVFSTEILYGRDFSPSEVYDSIACCMIDKSTARSLFGRENAVGKRVDVWIMGYEINCEIIAITATESGLLQSVGGEILPDFAYVPYSLINSVCSNSGAGSIMVRIENGYSKTEVSRSIVSVMNSVKGGDAIKVDDLSAQREKLDSILSIVTTVLSMIGIISLLVSGLGIMTIMLVSVGERTREIGVKKAIGASFYDIMSEFLLEALTISLIGCIIGSIFGSVLSIVGSRLFGVALNLSLGTIVYGFVSAMISGVVFGAYPALKAAKMTPVSALRYE